MHFLATPLPRRPPPARLQFPFSSQILTSSPLRAIILRKGDPLCVRTIRVAEPASSYCAWPASSWEAASHAPETTPHPGPPRSPRLLHTPSLEGRARLQPQDGPSLGPPEGSLRQLQREHRPEPDGRRQLGGCPRNPCRDRRPNLRSLPHPASPPAPEGEEMARKPKRAWTLGIWVTASAFLGWYAPNAKLAVESWIGSIVIRAVHQHWQWEQAQLQAEPLLKLIPGTPM